MKCLAINTATTVLSLALTDGDKPLHVFESTETRDQGNLLLNGIKTAMKESKLAFDDLDLLAVVTGPGSFTGIRIGLAAMRGIALATKNPLVGITSFDMFAVEGVTNLVAVESWREELYFTLIGPNGKTLIDPVNETPEQFMLKMKKFDEPIVISGDAAEKIAPLVNGKVMPLENAVKVAEFALSHYSSREFLDQKPVPFYLRPADISQPKAGKS